MFQNVKVDIIYYKVQTDFEMEFNLSGCCRMRLLTGKAPDRKNLVNQLVRAVSRSRIILLTGALFDKNGIIETCAKAIGRELTPVDNKRFGIQSQDSIEIISDSIPLVSTDGIFGGCIVEQGPQTLILLTDNRNVRKNVMQNLIHPYIKDVCAAEMTDKESNEQNPAAEIAPAVVVPPVIEAPIIPEAKPVLSELEPETELPAFEDEAQEEIAVELTQETLETEELQENSSETENEPVVDANDEDDLVLDDIPMGQEDIVDLSDDFVIQDDEEYIENAAKTVNEALDLEALNAQDLILDDESEVPEMPYMPEEFEDFLLDEEDDESKIPNFPISGINISIIIVAVLLLGLVAVLCYCIFLAPTKQEVGVAEYLKEVFDILFV